ncbi:uncharacterized protein LOC135939210 [Cloeon dipterum]|uniref:uncharacterized protein LOC135939210 n=1 Tax=Cloeon dipterum TaxID=197152 RepID=UPI003220499A
MSPSARDFSAATPAVYLPSPISARPPRDAAHQVNQVTRGNMCADESLGVGYGKYGRCCCVFSCLSVAAGIALLFLGLFLALLGLLQSAGHNAIRVPGFILLGTGCCLLLLAAVAALCPGGRECCLHVQDYCVQHGSRSQVGASVDGLSVDSVDCDPPPQLRVIPPTPMLLDGTSLDRRPETAPDFLPSIMR